MLFTNGDVYQKLNILSSEIEQAMSLTGLPVEIPIEPARNIQILPPVMHPKKIGLSTNEGKARMLHDLASIELQAMELALRTLHEFKDAPEQFRQDLAALTLSEGSHLKMALEGIESFGHKWGDWPVHVALWRAVDTQDELLDRILIVHRYLEGSGLDSGETMLRRLNGLGDKTSEQIVSIIVKEEVDHVKFGSDWYRAICKLQGLDPEVDFPSRIRKLETRLPKRLEPLSRSYRKQAGFTDFEMDTLEAWRMDYFKPVRN